MLQELHGDSVHMTYMYEYDTKYRDVHIRSCLLPLNSTEVKHAETESGTDCHPTSDICQRYPTFVFNKPSLSTILKP